MNNANTTLASKAGLSTLERAKFGPGMLLQHGDLELLNSYTRELSRLMFRSLFGCGVVCGLVVDTDNPCGKLTVKVKSGVAIACSGDPIYVPRDETIPITDDCEAEIDGPLWVVLCGTVKCCAPRPSICPSDDEDSKPECTREKEGYVIKVISGDRPECVCGCDENDAAWNTAWKPDCKCVNPALKCYEHHYEGDCGCDCDDCSDCKCDCILLAKLTEYGDNNEWEVDYRVRRFVRPVLIQDPLAGKKKETKEGQALSTKESKDAYLTGVRTSAPEVADTTAKAIWKRLSDEVGPKAADDLMQSIVPSEIASYVAKDAIARAEKTQSEWTVEEAKKSELAEIREKIKAESGSAEKLVISKTDAKKKQTTPKKSTGDTQ